MSNELLSLGINTAVYAAAAPLVGLPGTVGAVVGSVGYLGERLVYALTGDPLQSKKFEIESIAKIAVGIFAGYVLSNAALVSLASTALTFSTYASLSLASTLVRWFAITTLFGVAVEAVVLEAAIEANASPNK